MMEVVNLYRGPERRRIDGGHFPERRSFIVTCFRYRTASFIVGAGVVFWFLGHH